MKNLNHHVNIMFQQQGHSLVYQFITVNLIFHKNFVIDKEGRALKINRIADKEDMEIKIISNLDIDYKKCYNIKCI